MSRIPKLYKMTKKAYNGYIERVRKHCPRGKKFFCDGTPNPIPKGEYKGIGMCQHYKHGECTYFETRENKPNEN